MNKPHTRTHARASATPEGTTIWIETVIILADGTEIPAEPECEAPAFRTLCPKRRMRPAPKAAPSNVVGRVKLAPSDLSRFQKGVR